MKKTMNISYKILSVLLLAFIATGCTKLDEESFGRLSPSTYYQNENEANSSVAGIYQSLQQMQGVSSPWTISVEGTDEFIVPGRASGGWFDPNNIDIMQHNVRADNQTIAGAWTNVFSEIGIANAVLESLRSSSSADKFKVQIAEARALRAYGYFYAMDFWGNVPLVTVGKIEQNNLPVTTARADIFRFVETELLAAVADLPAANTVDKATYYPRLTKEAVYSLLAMTYLNAEVYTGTAKWAEAIAMCNNVINSGAFALEANVVDSFKALNKGKTREVIFAFSIDPARNSGSNAYILYSQPALDQQRYSLPFAPANGFSTQKEALDRYETQDKRINLLQYGPQFNLNGTPLLDTKGVQLNLVNCVSFTAAADNEGYRVLKYVPEGVTWTGPYGNNDLIQTRYADILLTKAEAAFRSGNTGDALMLINQVRSRSNATNLTSVTLKNLEEERAREFIWEGHRRRDMIRFGTYFNTTWTFKTSIDPVTKGIYPIPVTQLATNPNLRQNPGY